MTHPPLAQAALSDTARAARRERVLNVVDPIVAAAPIEFGSIMRRTIEEFARARTPFTSDDVRIVLTELADRYETHLQAPADWRCLAGALLTAMREQVISSTSVWVRSELPLASSRSVQVWLDGPAAHTCVLPLEFAAA